ncbi:MAG: HD domain-containing protein [Planctomycetes bacterium]|nr:HD domain-containing protein [Planctomycetota bacterium]
MDSLKRFGLRHLEVILILVIVGVMALVDRVVEQKITLLNFYFIPVLLAGYLRGQKMAAMTAVLCIASVIFCQFYTSQGSEESLLGYSLGAREFLEKAKQLDLPVTTTSPLLLRQRLPVKVDAKTKVRTIRMYREHGEMETEKNRRELLLEGLEVRVYAHIAAWGSFLFLSGVLVGRLSEERAKRMRDLHSAYVGVLDILTKYLQSADKYMRGHLRRVSEEATEIARKLEMDASDVDSVQAAAMLHDVTEFDVSMDLIERAAQMSAHEEDMLEFEMEPDAKTLAQTGSVLSKSISLVAAKDLLKKKAEKKGEGAKQDIPLGAQIVALVDVFDGMTTEEKKKPEEAFEQIGKDMPDLDEKLFLAAREVLLTSKSLAE